MRFVDEAKIWVRAGDGGKGCVSFRREKFVPRGGPDGGDGGRGGSIVLVATNKQPTLLDHSYQQYYRAPRGQHGRGSLQHGKNGEDLTIPVPLGTVVRDMATDAVLCDLVEEGQSLVVAQGGRGGRGNASFKSSTNRAPRIAQPGEPGQERHLKLELKLLADVGLVGLPNAGKSTLISKLSSAHPKIADYPFTTLTPHLGVVMSENADTLVVADIPGLIEGAHRGAGLGLKFLRHIERTKVLVLLVDASRIDPEDPGRDYRIIRSEFHNYNPSLLEKPYLIALNKMDLLGTAGLPKGIERFFQELGVPFVPISALTGEGTQRLLVMTRTAVGKRP